ncbi:MAG TPA: nucleotidyltransferase family protein [Chthoniobacterales bacterium]|nr:nucleotidyltransferase family protein [Chthoniobacterales bacterium]
MRNVGAVILAAGGSSRLGRPKQLLSLQGESLLRRAVRAAIEAGCACVTVVAGDARDSIESELRGTPAVVVENLEWQRGLGASIRCGLRHLLSSRPEIDAVVLLACDQPFLDAAVITSLIAQQANSGRPMVASSYAGTLGIPALFDRSCFEALLALPDDSGAKGLIESRPAEVAQIEFEKGAVDIDTPDDFAGLTNADTDSPLHRRRATP